VYSSMRYKSSSCHILRGNGRTLAGIPIRYVMNQQSNTYSSFGVPSTTTHTALKATEMSFGWRVELYDMVLYATMASESNGMSPINGGRSCGTVRNPFGRSIFLCLPSKIGTRKNWNGLRGYCVIV